MSSAVMEYFPESDDSTDACPWGLNTGPSPIGSISSLENKTTCLFDSVHFTLAVKMDSSLDHTIPVFVGHVVDSSFEESIAIGVHAL